MRAVCKHATLFPIKWSAFCRAVGWYGWNVSYAAPPKRLPAALQRLLHSLCRLNVFYVPWHRYIICMHIVQCVGAVITVILHCQYAVSIYSNVSKTIYLGTRQFNFLHSHGFALYCHIDDLWKWRGRREECVRSYWCGELSNTWILFLFTRYITFKWKSIKAFIIFNSILNNIPGIHIWGRVVGLWWFYLWLDIIGTFRYICIFCWIGRAIIANYSCDITATFRDSCVGHFLCCNKCKAGFGEGKGEEGVHSVHKPFFIILSFNWTASAVFWCNIHFNCIRWKYNLL